MRLHCTHLPAAILLFACCSHVAELATAFSTPTSCSLQHSRLSGREFSRVKIICAQNNNYDEEDEDEDEEEDGLDNLIGKKLGINIGAQLPALSPEEIEDIRIQAQATLDKAVDGRLADIEKLREELEEDLSRSRKRMETASELNVQYEKQNLMEKIDRLSDEFLNANADFRESTKKAAAADKVAASSGRGLDWGSWGSVGGLDVVIGPSESVLLGSVAAARKRATLEGDDDQPIVEQDNRVLVVVDEKKSKGSDRVMGRLKVLLQEAFESEIIVDSYGPTGNIPIGGNNAQTALIFASSLNDRSSLENLLGRVLKRTAPVAGSAPGMPPSHVVVVSGLGTERTNKMPYSMQNLLGGKLDKLREIEQAIVAISRSRIVGKQNPLDYTIVKFGDIASSDGNDDVSIEIRPGDVLDGEIGPNAAANVLLQALAYQPYARNSTLCSAGSVPEGATVEWNDEFVCLSGPELLRVDAGPGISSDDAILDPKYEQLAQYVQEWAATFEGDRKGTGLTTPVLVRKSRKPASEFDGVVARSGVRILFQTTNTGDRYKSATEEKLEEKQRSGGGAVKKSSKPLTTKLSKEGGVEVLVEKTTDGSIRVRARRCNLDYKTIVKEMSEGVIVRNLSKAIDAWVKAKGAQF
mmetsp:Transcript_20171/g.40406  ORF Transcript_20171/g.40406 Transcript_20171/m.40406 type:complete len:638 (+) Transcript_20171:51-1964(+)